MDGSKHDVTQAFSLSNINTWMLSVVLVPKFLRSGVLYVQACLLDIQISN